MASDQKLQQAYKDIFLSGSCNISRAALLKYLKDIGCTVHDQNGTSHVKITSANGSFQILAMHKEPATPAVLLGIRKFVDKHLEHLAMQARGNVTSPPIITISDDAETRYKKSGLEIYSLSQEERTVILCDNDYPETGVEVHLNSELTVHASHVKEAVAARDAVRIAQRQMLRDLNQDFGHVTKIKDPDVRAFTIERKQNANGQWCLQVISTNSGDQKENSPEVVLPCLETHDIKALQQAYIDAVMTMRSKVDAYVVLHTPADYASANQAASVQAPVQESSENSQVLLAEYERLRSLIVRSGVRVEISADLEKKQHVVTLTNSLFGADKLNAAYIASLPRTTHRILRRVQQEILRETMENPNDFEEVSDGNYVIRIPFADDFPSQRLIESMRSVVCEFNMMAAKTTARMLKNNQGPEEVQKLIMSLKSFNIDDQSKVLSNGYHVKFAGGTFEERCMDLVGIYNQISNFTMIKFGLEAAAKKINLRINVSYKDGKTEIQYEQGKTAAPQAASVCYAAGGECGIDDMHRMLGNVHDVLRQAYGGACLNEMQRSGFECVMHDETKLLFTHADAPGQSFEIPVYELRLFNHEEIVRLVNQARTTIHTVQKQRQQQADEEANAKERSAKAELARKEAEQRASGAYPHCQRLLEDLCTQFGYFVDQTRLRPPTRGYRLGEVDLPTEALREKEPARLPFILKRLQGEIAKCEAVLVRQERALNTLQDAGWALEKNGHQRLIMPGKKPVTLEYIKMPDGSATAMLTEKCLQALEVLLPKSKKSGARSGGSERTNVR